MSWLSRNWFRLGILIMFLIVGMPIAYYYGYLLPSEARTAELRYLRSEDLKCKERGESEYISRVGRYEENGWLIVGKYTFSSQYQACLEYRDISGSETGLHKQIISDLDSGKELFAWDNTNNASEDCRKVLGKNLCLTIEEFKEKRIELFGE